MNIEQIIGKKLFKVENVNNYKFDDEEYDGVIIEFSDPVLTEWSEWTLYFLIDNYQQCCEHFGYIHCEDAPNEFVGMTVTDVRVLDRDENFEIKELNLLLDSEKQVKAIFLNIDLSDGTKSETLQFVVYNAGSGYYEHEVIFMLRRSI